MLLVEASTVLTRAPLCVCVKRGRERCRVAVEIFGRTLNRFGVSPYAQSFLRGLGPAGYKLRCISGDVKCPPEIIALCSARTALPGDLAFSSLDCSISVSVGLAMPTLQSQNET